MSENKVLLSQLFDQEIYLIKNNEKGEYTDIEKEKDSQVEEKSIPYQGSNTSNVLVITTENPNKEELELLNNILNSVNLRIEEIALITYTREFEEVISTLSDIASSKIISFGITSGKSRLLDIQTKYSPSSIDNRTVIITDSLKEINSDKELKRKLWNCLKEIF